MKCIDIKENLSALLDGEIKKSWVSELETHLENCASCRTEYENLRIVGESLRCNLRVSAPVALDEKVLSAFQTFHHGKRGEKIEKAEKAGKAQAGNIGWFGVPRLALAAMFVVFALATIAAFQLGRMSGTNVELSGIETKTDAAPATLKTANVGEDDSPDNSTASAMRTIAVPDVKEKIIRIPVVREKIIVRTVYKNLNTEKNMKNDDKTILKNTDDQDFTVKSRLRDNQYSTQVNLKGFQVVSELKPVIIKGENNE